MTETRSCQILAESVNAEDEALEAPLESRELKDGLKPGTRESFTISLNLETETEKSDSVHSKAYVKSHNATVGGSVIGEAPPLGEMLDTRRSSNGSSALVSSDSASGRQLIKSLLKESAGGEETQYELSFPTAKASLDTISLPENAARSHVPPSPTGVKVNTLARGSSRIFPKNSIPSNSPSNSTKEQLTASSTAKGNASLEPLATSLPSDGQKELGASVVPVSKAADSRLVHPPLLGNSESLARLNTSVAKDENPITSGGGSPSASSHTSRAASLDREAMSSTSGVRDDSDIWQQISGKCRVLRPYYRRGTLDLSLSPGQVLRLVAKSSNGWYIGARNATSCFGFFPSHVVELIADNESHDCDSRDTLLGASVCGSAEDTLSRLLASKAQVQGGLGALLGGPNSMSAPLISLRSVPSMSRFNRAASVPMELPTIFQETFINYQDLPNPLPLIDPENASAGRILDAMIEMTTRNLAMLANALPTSRMPFTLKTANVNDKLVDAIRRGASEKVASLAIHSPGAFPYISNLQDYTMNTLPTTPTPALLQSLGSSGSPVARKDSYAVLEYKLCVLRVHYQELNKVLQDMADNVAHVGSNSIHNHSSGTLLSSAVGSFASSMADMIERGAGAQTSRGVGMEALIAANASTRSKLMPTVVNSAGGGPGKAQSIGAIISPFMSRLLASMHPILHKCYRLWEICYVLHLSESPDAPSQLVSRQHNDAKRSSIAKLRRRKEHKRTVLEAAYILPSQFWFYVILLRKLSTKHNVALTLDTQASMKLLITKTTLLCTAIGACTKAMRAEQVYSSLSREDRRLWLSHTASKRNGGRSKGADNGGGASSPSKLYQAGNRLWGKSYVLEMPVMVVTSEISQHIAAPSQEDERFAVLASQQSVLASSSISQKPRENAEGSGVVRLQTSEVFSAMLFVFEDSILVTKDAPSSKPFFFHGTERSFSSNGPSPVGGRMRSGAQSGEYPAGEVVIGALPSQTLMACLSPSDMYVNRHVDSPRLLYLVTFQPVYKRVFLICESETMCAVLYAQLSHVITTAHSRLWAPAPCATPASPGEDELHNLKEDQQRLDMYKGWKKVPKALQSWVKGQSVRRQKSMRSKSMKGDNSSISAVASHFLERLSSTRTLAKDEPRRLSLPSTLKKVELPRKGTEISLTGLNVDSTGAPGRQSKRMAHNVTERRHSDLPASSSVVTANSPNGASAQLKAVSLVRQMGRGVIHGPRRLTRRVKVNYILHAEATARLDQDVPTPEMVDDAVADETRTLHSRGSSRSPSQGNQPVESTQDATNTSPSASQRLVDILRGRTLSLGKQTLTSTNFGFSPMGNNSPSSTVPGYAPTNASPAKLTEKLWSLNRPSGDNVSVLGEPERSFSKNSSAYALFSALTSPWGNPKAGGDRQYEEKVGEAQARALSLVKVSSSLDGLRFPPSHAARPIPANLVSLSKGRSSDHFVAYPVIGERRQMLPMSGRSTSLDVGRGTLSVSPKKSPRRGSKKDPSLEALSEESGSDSNDRSSMGGSIRRLSSQSSFVATDPRDNGSTRNFSTSQFSQPEEIAITISEAQASGVARQNSINGSASAATTINSTLDSALTRASVPVSTGETLRADKEQKKKMEPLPQLSPQSTLNNNGGSQDGSMTSLFVHPGGSLASSLNGSLLTLELRKAALQAERARQSTTSAFPPGKLTTLQAPTPLATRSPSLTPPASTQTRDEARQKQLRKHGLSVTSSTFSSRGSADSTSSSSPIKNKIWGEMSRQGVNSLAGSVAKHARNYAPALQPPNIPTTSTTSASSAADTAKLYAELAKARRESSKPGVKGVSSSSAKAEAVGQIPMPSPEMAALRLALLTGGPDLSSTRVSSEYLTKSASPFATPAVSIASLSRVKIARGSFQKDKAAPGSRAFSNSSVLTPLFIDNGNLNGITDNDQNSVSPGSSESENSSALPSESDGVPQPGPSALREQRSPSVASPLFRLFTAGSAKEHSPLGGQQHSPERSFSHFSPGGTPNGRRSATDAQRQPSVTGGGQRLPVSTARPEVSPGKNPRERATPAIWAGINSGTERQEDGGSPGQRVSSPPKHTSRRSSSVAEASPWRRHTTAFSVGTSVAATPGANVSGSTVSGAKTNESGSHSHEHERSKSKDILGMIPTESEVKQWTSSRKYAQAVLCLVAQAYLPNDSHLNSFIEFINNEPDGVQIMNQIQEYAKQLIDIENQDQRKRKSSNRSNQSANQTEEAAGSRSSISPSLETDPSALNGGSERDISIRSKQLDSDNYDTRSTLRRSKKASKRPTLLIVPPSPRSILTKLMNKLSPFSGSVKEMG